MRIPRIYYNDDLIVNTTILLSSEASHYILQVLRLKLNASLHLFNGKGGEYIATLIAIKKKHALVTIHRFIVASRESPLYIHLGQGISRNEKMDFTIQKAVELGVTKITPLQTQFCTVKSLKEREQKRLQHWQKIITSACEQSGRNDVPAIMPVMNITEWLTQCHEQIRLLCEPTGQTLNWQVQNENKIALLIGPEGGLSENEIQFAKQAGFQCIHLGPRILRTETAALAAITVLQSHWGDMP